MPLIEIVSHCWAEELEHYSTALRFQLSSLILHPPVECNVMATICCVPTDWRTYRELCYFARAMTIKIIPMSRDHIGRRSIGRNIAAKQTGADIVWFADCDQAFLHGILDQLATMVWPEPSEMIFPRRIMIHKDWDTGDAVTSAEPEEPRLVDLDESLFTPKRYFRAIGGVQIVRGDFAREHGYLDGIERWQRPPAGHAFKDFRDDVHYRHFCKAKAGGVPPKAVDLPGVYRIRHGKTTHN